MRATRLAAAGVAAGALVLGMAGPALATPTPTLPTEPPTTSPTTPGTPVPSPTATQTPQFRFGYDKVKLSTRRVAPGVKVTFTVTCPTDVTISGNGYTQNPLPVKKTGEATWTGTGTYRSNLPDPTTVTVVCKNYGSVKYSTSPEKGDGNGNGNGNGGGMTPKTPKIPTGRINTGDGSSLRDNGSPLPAAALGAFAVIGLGAVALRRQVVRERS